MPFNVVDRSTENFGSMHMERITIDITTDGELTGLSDAGHEAIDAGSQARLVDWVNHVYVAGQEDPSFAIAYDHLNDQLHVHDVSDGTTTASGTDVGEVELVVVGS